VKILKYLGIFVLGLVVVLAAALTTIWWKPQILLNEKMAKKALKYAPEELKVSWKGFRWDFQRTGFLAKRMDLDLTDLCFSYGPSMEGCAPHFQVDISFAFESLIPSITRIDKVDALVSHFVMHPTEAVKDPLKGPLPDLRAPSFADYYPSAIDAKTLGQVSLEVKEFRMESKEGPPLLAKLKFAKQNVPGANDIQFRLDADATQGKDLNLVLAGDGRVPPGEKVFAFNGSARGKVAGWNMNLPLTLRWGTTADIQTQADLRQKGTRFNTPLELHWSPKELKAQTGALSLGAPMQGRKLGIDRCELVSRMNAKKGFPEKTTLTCGLSMQSRTSAKALPTVKSTLVGDLNLKPLDRDRVKADFTLNEKGERPLLPSHINASLQAEINVTEGTVLGEPILKFDGFLGTENMAEWVPILRGTPYAIPAPLNVLTGPIHLEMKLDKVDGRKEVAVTAVLTTNLTGAGQSLVTRSEAMIRVTNPFDPNRALFADAKVVLQNVQVEAPPLQLGLPPNGIPDSRFVTNAQLKAKKEAEKLAEYDPGMPVEWSATITNEQPIRISTNLLKNAVPLAVNLKLGSKNPMEGFVEVLPMPINIFSKKADVQSIKVSFLPRSKVMQLNGVVVNKTSEVEIRILLLGSTEKPRVEFESDPPLDRDQIVSVLLFNKSLAEVQKQVITDDEAQSSSNVSQAMSDGAFGLFSLFFLSSTPIQSVGYDAASQSYNIRFKLGDKTTLGLGSNFGNKREVSLRRSLGGPWAIRTELTQEQEKPNVLLTMLEWFKRF
jgi:hypothetical protein